MTARKMVWVKRFLVSIAAAYVLLAAVLWWNQSQLIYPAPQSASPPPPGYEEVELLTEDGLTLRAFYRPAEEARPTIVYFHGNGGTISGATRANWRLAEAGIGALLVEYRGYGGNPGEPSEQGLYRDGEAAMSWLSEQGFDLRDIIITANSIGGGVAVEMAARHDPKALVLVAPFTSLPDAAQAALWWAPGRNLVRDQYRNAEKIAALDMPVLVLHGDADNVVPFEHGQRLAELAPNASFLAFAGSGHGLSFDPRSQEARRDWILALDN